MITIFIAENCPWCYYTDITGGMLKIGRSFGEWAWVGRVR